VAAIDCETNAACTALSEQGQQQSKAGQFAEAEKSYKLAYEVSHDERLLFNIARVLDKRGQDPAAITYYRRFIGGTLSDETQKAKARSYLEQLEAKGAARTRALSTPAAKSAKSGAEALTASREANVTPAYKRGWLWGVVIGSVAAVGLGVGLGVGLTDRGQTVPSRTNTIAF
jgi:tetratricopeptide (TPR) repeat protein